MSDLPANAWWFAWLVAALAAGFGVLGLVNKRMTFSIPLPHRPTTPDRLRFRRVVSGNLARAIAVGYLGVGALALASFKMGAIVAFVLGVAGWLMGTSEDG